MQQKIYIDGMTCVSCEILINNELKEIDGIKKITVCHKKKIAEIIYDEKKIDIQKIIGKIKKLGYLASLEPDKTKPDEKTSKKQWVYSLLIVIGLYLIYKGLLFLGLLNWINFDVSNINYGVAFLIGIVASLSTCLAIVGAVVLSFSAKYETRGNFYQKNVRPHLLFHLGRLLTFFVLGGILGTIGSWFNLSTSFMGGFTILIAIVLAWLGLNILGIFPSLSTVGIHMPKHTLNTWNKLKESEHALAPIILGGFTFFLPCGFTQSMQLFAISSGSFLTGALTLFLFALGTLPVLMGLGIATTRFKNMKSIIFKKVIGFVVILFAFFTLSTGFALVGFNINLFEKTGEKSVVSKESTQVVKMDITYSGFSPNVFEIKKDIPVKWIINGKQATGCTNEIIIPSLNISQKIKPGENIVEFTPKKAGTINFSCWMGMVRGRFIVK